jgi:hypothetical protein
MAKFTDVYKQELKSKGVLSSIGSSVLKQTKERLDPRNILFGGKGFIGATGRKIFGEGFKAVPQKRLREDGDSLKAEALGALLESSKRTEGQLVIIGKNTMPLRAISRDMNVVGQNIIKLVKLGGGNATNKADAFFRSQKEEETAYENALRKLETKTDSGKKVSKEEQPTGQMGLLGSLFGGLKSLGSSLAGILTATLGKIPGLIFNGIKDIFTNLPKLVGSGIKGAALTLPMLWKALKIAGARLLTPLITSPFGLAALGVGGMAWLIGKIYEDTNTQNRIEKLVEENKLPDTESYPDDPQKLEEYLTKLEDAGPNEEMLAARYRSQISGIPLEDVLKDISERRKKRLMGIQPIDYSSQATDMLGTPLPQDVSGLGLSDVKDGTEPFVGPPREYMKQNQTSFEKGRTTPTRVPDNYIDPGKKQILNEIGLKESRGDYNALVYGKNTPKRASLVGMTLQEVLNYQNGMVSRGHASTAVGKYQITRDTLEEFAKKAGVSMEEKFTPFIQDKIAAKILDEAGYTKFAKGEISRDTFTNNVARRWAAMPSTTGKSFYDGIAGNRSLISLQNAQQLYSSSAALSNASNNLKDMQNNLQAPTENTTFINNNTPAPPIQQQSPDKISALNVDALQLFAGNYV